MLVKHCLEFLGEGIGEFGLKLNVAFCTFKEKQSKRSNQGKKKRPGFKELKELKLGLAAVHQLNDFNLRKLHAMHHMGMDSTLYFTRRMPPTLPAGASKRWPGTVISVNPSAMLWLYEQGNILVEMTNNACNTFLAGCVSLDGLL